MLMEAVGSDSDDELDGFSGQLVPGIPGDARHVITARPESRGRHTGIHRSIVLPDGRRGMAWASRPGGHHDVTIYGRTHADDRDAILHRSEFEFSD